MSIGEFARRSRLSPKALRLYDDLGLLVPQRVDEVSGYRFYGDAQLDRARLIAALRQIDVPLAEIKALLDLAPQRAAERLASLWQQAEQRHASHRELVSVLVQRLKGLTPVTYDVATRMIPRRHLLCLKRNVDPDGAWALGKEFIGILRAHPMPKLDGRAGAAFSIFWGEVSADSDGPVEWCRPVPDDQSDELAARVPELTLRIEPAHEEAYVALGAGADDPAQWQLADQSLRSWAAAHDITPAALSLTPEDLGVRITYLFAEPAPDRDFAIAFARIPQA
ncbi:MAG TPA: helix-turn-helix domain-containing protein [Mycobacteriales bacterium]|jgi:DNA-binding transcriptional MerR regulator|nr:helix-turn-helix domain-containing protein [Mycobacteriales bacterium]